MSIAYKIKNLFFNNSVIKLQTNLEGQFAKNKTFYVGAKAGPGLEISNLLHEICHFAEFSVKRLRKFPTYGWGFYPGKYWQFGTSFGYEPQTSQQVFREARVWAFQLSLSKELSLDDSSENLVRSAVWLPAFCYYKYSFDNTSDKKSLYYLSKHVERLSKNRFTFDKLMSDFNERIQELEKIQ